MRCPSLTVVQTILLLALTIPGCASTQLDGPRSCPVWLTTRQDSQFGKGESGLDKASESVVSFAEGLIGLEESLARSCVEGSNLLWRVVARDDEAFAVTFDYRSNRVNAVIEDSLVTDISIG